VIVREQDGINAVDAGCYQLEAQLRRRIDENPRSAVSFDKRANTCPFVSGIRRSADLARTSNLGDAKAGSRPQEGELQTVSTLSKLVVPGISNGTPAVTMMRSPFEASSLSMTTDLVRSIISS